jgi:hypothetical protein
MNLEDLEKVLEEQANNALIVMENLVEDSDHYPAWKVAQMFNLSAEKLQRLVEEEGLPRQADGTFAMDQVIEWVHEKQMERFKDLGFLPWIR